MFNQDNGWIIGHDGLIFRKLNGIWEDNCIIKPMCTKACDEFKSINGRHYEE